MTPFGQLTEDVLDALKKKYSKDRKIDVQRWINQAYFEIAAMHSWHALRETVDLDFNDGDETGEFLPTDMLGIDRVRDTTNEVEFIGRDEADIDPQEMNFRYYTYPPTNETLVYGDDLSVTQGSGTLSGTGITATHVGEWVQFGTEFGYYKLLTATTFEPTYRGPSLTGSEFHVRPPSTLKLNLVDAAENELTDRTVRVYHWRCPRPLYRASDMMMLPSSRPVELMTLIKAMGTIGKRQIATDRYRGELDDALALAMRMNPDLPRKARPRDVHNQLFTLTSSPFGTRANPAYTSGMDPTLSLRDMLRR